MLKASGVKSVIIYGIGDIAEIALLSMQEASIDVAGIISKRHSGQMLCGTLVYPPESLLALTYDRVVVLEHEREEATKVLNELGVEMSKIHWVGA